MNISPRYLPVILLGMLGLLGACAKPEPAPEPVRAVKVVTMAASDVQAAQEYAAEVRPRIESRLGFRVGGKIIRRQAEVGQKVRTGQALAELDASDYRLAADAAKAQVNSAMVNRNLAAADYKRYQHLKDQNFISGTELDRREAALKAAQAQLEQAQAQLAAQGNQASYATLVADRDGVVTAIDAEPGQVVAAGTPVVRIAVDGPRDVVFNVPEDRVAALSTGTPVQVRVWASQALLHGVVREVGSSADPVTRTFLVKATLDGKDAPALGSTVYASPQNQAGGARLAIKLPTSALRQDGGSSAVWLLDTQTMTVKSQAVKVLTADDNLAVIGSGLQPGDQVVSAGVHVLAPGQKVSLYRDKYAPSPSGTAAK